VLVNATTDYILAAEGPGGRNTSKLTIRAAIASPVITLQATPNTLHPGEATRLQWNVTGADQLSLYPAIGTVRIDRQPGVVVQQPEEVP